MLIATTLLMLAAYSSASVMVVLPSTVLTWISVGLRLETFTSVVSLPE